MKKIEDIINRVHCADCLEFMKTMPENSIDTIITDPPYGLGFMNKEWDKPVRERELIEREKRRSEQRFKEGKGPTTAPFSQSVRPGLGIKKISNEWYQEWSKKWAKECLRVAKPGATMLCFGGTRTYHRLACAIEDAGWQIFDCIFYCYGSGFPKSTNISLMLDKNACKKQLAEKFGRKPTKEEFKKEWEGFRKIKERNPNSREGCDKSNTLYESGTVGKTAYITEPTTPEAKLWDGWGTALKPAVEPIVCARKPNEGSYVENALKWEVAGLNIDGGRIGNKPRLTGTKKAGKEIKAQPTSFKGSGTRKLQTSYDEKMIETNQGRFPANLILECICDEVREGEIKGDKRGITFDKKASSIFGSKSVSTKAEIKNPEGKEKTIIHTNPECPCYILDKQSDNASRFFYTAKASREERNRGLERFEGKDRKEEWGDKFGAVDRRLKTGSNSVGKFKNIHPTVKPLKLMEYLCLLIKTPRGGIILDPFAGSGTTGMAAKKVGRDYILIEKEEDYCKIAEARIKAIPQPLF